MKYYNSSINWQYWIDLLQNRIGIRRDVMSRFCANPKMGNSKNSSHKKEWSTLQIIRGGAAIESHVNENMKTNVWIHKNWNRCVR